MIRSQREHVSQRESKRHMPKSFKRANNKKYRVKIWKTDVDKYSLSTRIPVTLISPQMSGKKIIFKSTSSIEHLHYKIKEQ